jgi:hypothetical protein
LKKKKLSDLSTLFKFHDKSSSSSTVETPYRSPAIDFAANYPVGHFSATSKDECQMDHFDSSMPSPADPASPAAEEEEQEPEEEEIDAVTDASDAVVAIVLCQLSKNNVNIR